MYTDLIVFYLNALILAPYPTKSDGAGFKPVFDTNPANITAIKGQTVFLNCTVNYLEDYKVAWLNPENKVLTNNDRRIIDDIRITIEHDSTTEWNLHFRNIQHFDEGVYTCAINTDPVQTKRVYLKVLVPSRIDEKGSTFDIQAVEGSTVQLVCNATGIPPPTVQWFRHIPSATPEKAMKEAVVEPGEVLLIHNVSRYCGGLYECVAYNNVDKAASRKMEVEVIFRPEIELPTRRISQVVNKETILQCIIRANPLLSSQWVRNGIRLENGGKFRIDIFDKYTEIYTKVLDLQIRNVKKEDYGNYTCIASNKLGEDKETMLLYEMVQPTFAPTTVKGTTSPAVHLAPYEVHGERTTKPTEIIKTRPGPGNYRPRNSGFKLLFNIRYITLLFIVCKCLLL